MSTKTFKRKVKGKIIDTGCIERVNVKCSHPTVMKDMCAECGLDLRKTLGGPGERKEGVAASVAMVHNIPELIISQEHAIDLGKADQERLLKSRRLALLVDLDQTLIHTTNDTIPANLKDVFHFQHWHGNQPLWYHTKIRPNAQQFLKAVSKLYELHICTFGSRAYAHTIAEFLDPDAKYFSHRILSRDECFSSNSKTANLKALFPCGDRLVCIIDDREDVWNFAPNLIHVKPYHFFQGTADINAPVGLEKTEADDKLVTHRIRRISHTADGSCTVEEIKIGTNDTGTPNGSVQSQSIDEDTQEIQVNTEIGKGNEEAIAQIKISNADSQDDIKDNADTEQIDVTESNTLAESADSVMELSQQTDSTDSLNDANQQTDSIDRVTETNSIDRVTETDQQTDSIDMGTEADQQTNSAEMVTVGGQQTDSAEMVTVCDQQTDSVDKATEPGPTDAAVNDTASDQQLDFADLNTEKENNDSPVTIIQPEVSNVTSQPMDSIVHKVTAGVCDMNGSDDLDKGIHTHDISTPIGENMTAQQMEEQTPNEMDKTTNLTDSSLDNTSKSELSLHVKGSLSEQQDSTLEEGTMESKSNDDDEMSDKSNILKTTIEAPDPDNTRLISQSSSISVSEEIEWVDEDDYLFYLEDTLVRLHKAFFKIYDQASSDPESVNGEPDMKAVIPYVKRKVLRGVNVVFSGVIPTNMQPDKCRAYLVAKSLGANIQTNYVVPSKYKTDATTHVIAARLGTAKVNMAKKYKGVYVVLPDWLWSCIERWEHVDERLFLLTKDNEKPLRNSPVIFENSNNNLGGDGVDAIVQGYKRKIDNDNNLMMNGTDENPAKKIKESTKELPKEPQIFYDKVTGKRINTHPTLKSEKAVSAVNRDSAKGSRSQDLQNDTSFLSSFNPLHSFSDDELKDMDKEVDDLLEGDDEEEMMQDSNNEGESDREEQVLRKAVLSSPGSSDITDSESDDSLSGDYPRGCGIRHRIQAKRHSRNEEQRAFDVVDEAEQISHQEAEEVAPLEMLDSDCDDKRDLFVDNNSSSSQNDFADSIGSVDDEIAEAVEREFLS